MQPDETTTTEIEWVERACAGSEEAFTLLFRRYYDRIRNFGFRVVLDSQTADDVAQETFIRAARKLRQMRDAGAFESWLFQIARNVARDRVRAEQAHRRKLERAAAVRIEEPGTPPRNDAAQRAVETLRKLPPSQREAVALVYFDGFSHGEAAERLGCAESTVSWRIFRAKRKLRMLLNGSRPE